MVQHDAFTVVVLAATPPQHGPSGQHAPSGQHDAFAVVVMVVLAAVQQSPSGQQDAFTTVVLALEQHDFFAVVFVAAVVQHGPSGQHAPSGQQDALTLAV